MNNSEGLISEGQLIIDQFSKAISEITLNKDFSDTVKEIILCKGKIITSGMGKAGIIMKKFSSTLCSLGFPSAYVHPGESSHGDAGILSPNDLLFIASTSGKTREVLELENIARNVGVYKIVGITSHSDSPIREKADLLLDMGEIEEAGHLKIAPSTSTLVMMAIVDSVALTAASAKGLTFQEYHKCHHSGYLGQLAKEKGNEESSSSIDDNFAG